MNGARVFRQESSVGASRRFVARLRDDAAGNVLAIGAVALVMLLAAIGGAVDIGRAYVTKTNLQAACDAGVLAGRRALSKSGDYGATEKAMADKMFNFNMHAEQTDSMHVTFETEADDAGSVTGDASATMPVTIMAIFDAGDIDLNVDCSAELQMASADVMFVLDVTGSMGGTKIQGLRDAVREFHTTVANAVIDKDKTVIRYGFVPYSQTVNAKGILSSGAMPAEWFSDQTLYQSRVAVFDTPYDTYPARDTITAPTVVQQYGAAISKSDCDKYVKNTYPSSSGKNPETAGGPAPAATTSTLYAKPASGYWTETGTVSGTKVGTCKRNRTVSTTTYDTLRLYKFTKWRYKPVTVETTGLAENGSLPLVKSLSTDKNWVPVQGEYDMRTLATMRGANTVLTAPTSATWNGCLEERQTVINYAMSPVPDAALDLNINDAPEDDNDATKWKPMWGTMVYNRGTTSVVDDGTNFSWVGEACPAPMRQFEEVDTTNPSDVPDWLDNYLDELVAVGSTYHDIGMIWGARLASPKGMYSENVLEGDRNSVSRHILFMTDGVMEPGSTSYNAYGIEDIDHRIAPAGSGSGANSTLSKYHTNRFLAACQRAKEEGYTIWVVGFGTAITTAMKTCSSGDRAYFASNTTELKNAFRYIAGQVADLRINK